MSSSPPNPPERPDADEGPRWLSRGATPEAPVAETPGPPSVQRKELEAEIGINRWKSYLRLAAIVLGIVGLVVAGLLLMARAPRGADAMKSLGAEPSVSPSGTAAPRPSVSAPTPIPIPPPPSVAEAESAAAAAAAASAAAAEQAAAAAAASAAAAAAGPGADEGLIRTTVSGHRVFVDGKYVGDAPGPLKVKCGKHVVKVGSGGRSHDVDVPCAGEVTVPR